MKPYIAPAIYRNRGITIRNLKALGIIVVLALGGAPAVAEQWRPDFDRTMAWSAYNLGTTGYNQAVAIGKALKDHYDVNLRVVPGKNDVSRLMPLVKKFGPTPEQVDRPLPRDEIPRDSMCYLFTNALTAS